MTDDLADLPQPEYEGPVAVDALETDGDNPNEMTDEQFGLLCDRIRENGWLGGPIVTDTDGLIADGEHRWRAAQDIGLAEVPVRQYDIDDAERRLWRQELNKIHGEHDTKRDALEYDYLLDAGKADEVHELTQAADEDLDELLAEIKMETSTPAAYEYDPEHNVYFEDCVEGMQERVADDSVDMVFTSPPYNWEKEQGGERETEVVTYTDDLDDSEYYSFLSDVFQELARVVKPDGHIFVNHNKRLRDGVVSPSDFIPELMPVDWRSHIIWYKPNGAQSMIHLNNDGRFYDNWEDIYHFSGEPNALLEQPQYSVWEVSTAKSTEDTGEHPAPFPMELPLRAIKATTDAGDMVLDPFMGAGTTAVAAIQNNRDYVGFELDEQGAYKPIIERRIGEAKRQIDAGVNADD